MPLILAMLELLDILGSRGILFLNYSESKPLLLGSEMYLFCSLGSLSFLTKACYITIFLLFTVSLCPRSCCWICLAISLSMNSLSDSFDFESSKNEELDWAGICAGDSGTTLNKVDLRLVASRWADTLFLLLSKNFLAGEYREGDPIEGFCGILGVVVKLLFILKDSLITFGSSSEGVPFWEIEGRIYPLRVTTY